MSPLSLITELPPCCPSASLPSAFDNSDGGPVLDSSPLPSSPPLPPKAPAAAPPPKRPAAPTPLMVGAESECNNNACSERRLIFADSPWPPLATCRLDPSPSSAYDQIWFGFVRRDHRAGRKRHGVARSRRGGAGEAGVVEAGWERSDERAEGER